MRRLGPSAGPKPWRCLFHITPVIPNSYFTPSSLLFWTHSTQFAPLSRCFHADTIWPTPSSLICLGRPRPTQTQHFRQQLFGVGVACRITRPYFKRHFSRLTLQSVTKTMPVFALRNILHPVKYILSATKGAWIRLFVARTYRLIPAREASFVCSGWSSSGCDLYLAPPVGRCPSLLTAVTGVMPR